MKPFILVAITLLIVGCATLTNDPMTPIALSFSDGSSGECELSNKRGLWSIAIPATISVRRSDDALKYDCRTRDGREVVGSIASTVGAKIVASAVFLDFGITDAITDKHREYTASYVIPIEKQHDGSDDSIIESVAAKNTGKSEDKYSKIKELDELRQEGILTDVEFEVEKKKLLDAD